VSTVDEIAALELEARQLPSVAAVACHEDDGVTTVQVLVTDPGTLTVVRRDLEALLRRLPAERSVLEVEAVGAPRWRLAFERDLTTMLGVRSCLVARGARGEVRHVTVLLEPGADVAAVRAHLAESIGPDLPAELVEIETTDA
jgi:hypothetical protein